MSSSDYRKRTQRKGIITTVIAGAVIIAAVVAIIVAIIALTNNDDKTAAADATSVATEEASVQPTMYRGDAVTSTQPVPTSVPSGNSGASPTTPAAQTATEAPAVTPTEAPAGNTSDTPIDPGAAETPANTDDNSGSSDNSDNTGTGAIRSEAPLDTYTDDSGVLHIITPAGYNWTYQSDGSHVSITCDPHDDRYEFLVTGVAPGSEDIIPQYFVAADKSAWVRVPVTVSVDENLRVTVAG